MTHPEKAGRARSVEARTQELGRRLYRLAKQKHAHLSTLNRWTQQMLQWCLTDPALKSRVLRFVDVLPSLHSARSVVRHVREYFPTHDLHLPPALRLGVSLSRTGLLTAPALALIIRQMVERISEQFIAGTTVEEAARLFERMASEQMTVSLDVLGEQVVSEAEASNYSALYVNLIRALSETLKKREVSGDLSAHSSLIHVSLKPSAFTTHFDPLAFDLSLDRALERLSAVTAAAVEHGALINLDTEQYEYRDLTLGLARRTLDWFGSDSPLRLGVVIQAYLRDAEEAARDFLEWLDANGRRVWVRLVKGAYWDHEVAKALQHNWPVPVYQEKPQTDASFERLTEMLMQHPRIRLSVASHNVRSIARAMALAEERGLGRHDLEFQFLFGMGESIQRAVAQMGYPVRIYAPVGELIPGMAYLVRRILENTSNESFLRQDLWEGVSVDTLLRPPQTA